MLKNYFKVAYRNLLKYKGYAAINIAGLAIGLATSMLIFLWVADEVSFDNFHEKGDRLYRVMEDQIYPDQFFTFQSTPGGLAELLEEEIPEVKNATRITWNSEELLSVGEVGFWDNGFYADPDFLTLFSFPVVEGSAESALAGRHGMVITKELADKMFPDEGSVLGKTIRVNETDEYKVTAVVETPPANSSLTFQFILPFDVYLSGNDWLLDLGNNGIRTFVLTHQAGQLAQINEKIRMIIKEHNEGSVVEVFLQSVEDMYLHDKFTETIRGGGRIEYVQLFTIIGLIIILIACINFMNLSTARSARRAREVGVRKVVGSTRGMLMGQFLGESFLIVLIATFLALAGVYFLLPSFNELTGKEIGLPLTDFRFYLALILLVSGTSFFAGAYPAFFLSRFNMISVIKGSFRTGKGAAFFRKGLVVFQFALSIALIAGTFVIRQQVQYIKTKNIGLDRENVIYFMAPDEVKNRFSTFREEALTIDGVANLAMTMHLPTNVGNSTQGVDWPGKDPESNILFDHLAITPGAVETFGMTMKYGRSFDDRLTDTTAIILNEEAVNRMKLEDPVGEVISFWGEDRTVIGIVNDFHSNSLHRPIEPLVLTYFPDMPSTVVAKISGDRMEKTLAELGDLQKKFEPAYPFDYYFLDENFEKTYKSETLIGTLVNYFAFMAIFISGLGLFALASYTAEQRRKEIGIRKVLGAEVGQLVYLIGSHFALLVIIAFIVAVPLTYSLLSGWLENYAYHVELNWLIFVLAGVAAFIVAALTVSYHSYKAASVNPADTLRNE
ncbi:ABC transporter permease [Roseivirga sp. BDSF3-8]|uniref:ABC transporter permease n=1 Tax=Roseivirga sp. BDSF3-8 TaxID=3241598 RepID=UPI003531A051